MARKYVPIKTRTMDRARLNAPFDVWLVHPDFDLFMLLTIFSVPRVLLMPIGLPTKTEWRLNYGKIPESENYAAYVKNANPGIVTGH